MNKYQQHLYDGYPVLDKYALSDVSVFSKTVFKQDGLRILSHAKLGRTNPVDFFNFVINTFVFTWRRNSDV